MPAARVVETLNEIDDRSASLVVRAERRTIDQLTLERRKEALTHCIVEAVANRSHGRPNACFPASRAELDRRVLTTLVGMMNDSRRTSLRNGHVQGGRDQRRPQMCSYRAADALASPHVE